MTFDFLPPQAYTKDTLLKAYNWLQSQSDGVKEMATTPDQLVSLYLKASRLGQDPQPRNPAPSNQENTERPSHQNFKSELKNLAGMMGDLEKKQMPLAPQQAAPQQPVYTPPPQPQPQVVAQPAPSQYDELTLSMIREVKTELNLSQDQEALRMLVKLGYQRIKSVYK